MKTALTALVVFALPLTAGAQGSKPRMEMRGSEPAAATEAKAPMDHSKMDMSEAGHAAHRAHEGHDMEMAPEPVNPPSAEELGIGIDEKLGAAAALDIFLQDEDGKPLRLRELLDMPVFLSLNYFQCAGICTPQLVNMSRALSRVGMRPGEDFRFLTVSFDPKDTPAAAREKRDMHLKMTRRDLPAGAWRFLVGKPEDTRALADSVGFRFRPWKRDFIHPGALIVLSPEGKVTRYLYGVSYLPAEIQMAALDASRGVVKPTVSKVLKFCFSFDPESRKYVFNITRVVGTVVLLTAAVFLSFVIFYGRGAKDDG